MPSFEHLNALVVYKKYFHRHLLKVGQMPPGADWSQSFAAASYMPSKIETRLKVMGEMLVDGPSEYDKFLDAEGFIWVREPSAVEPDLVGLRRHALLGAATYALIGLVASGKPGTRVLNRPDSGEVELFKSFLGQMSRDDFARKYLND